MAREPLVVDFLGLGSRLVEKNNGGRSSSLGEAREASDRVTLVKPIATVPEKKKKPAVIGMSRRASFSGSDKALDRENSISRLRQGSPSFQLGRVRPPSADERDEEMQISGIMVNSSEKNALEKPLEELTDADILQLTREDCRQYLKDRDMQSASWNKQHEIQQVFSLRHHTDPRSDDEKPAKRESPHTPRHIPSPSLSEWEHTMTSAHPHVSKHGGLPGGFSNAMRAHMKMSLVGNSLQAPRVVPNTASQMSSFGEEAQQSAQPSKHAGAGADSHFSLRVPATQQNQPVAGHGAGFGPLLPALNGVSKMNYSSERGMAMTGQQPPQMQGRNMQSSSRLAYTGGMGMQQRAAQLTIFYAGMVNVYDDISLEKAQAIMMLAGSANTRSSNHTDAPTTAGSSRGFSAPMSGPQSSPASPAPHPTQTATTTTVTVPSSPAVPPPELLPALIASALRQPAVRNVQIELPQARKASLARFLEKRKDRVRSKGPYPPKPEGSTTTPPREKSPTPPISKPQSRSSSPAVVNSGMQKQLLFSPNLARHCTSVGSELNSQAVASETLSKQTAEEDRSAGNSAGRDCGVDNREASGGQNGKPACRLSSQTRRDEAMEEAAS